MGKASKKQGIAATVQAVAAVTENAQLASIGVQSEVQAPQVQSDTVAPVVAPVATVQHNDRLATYRELSSKAFAVPVAEGEEFAVPNKRAMVAALYCVVCSKLGVDTTTPGNMQQPIVRFVARLLPYANTGYSKQKGRILQGSEVTQSGMLQYARFLQKAECAKLLPNGELHTRTVQATKAAEALFTLHAEIEGYKGLAAQYSNATSK